MARYSRLQTIEEKRRVRKATSLLFLTVLIIIGVIFLGFKILTQIFLFISQWNSGGQAVARDDFIPPSPPQLFLPAEATNSAQISLFGYSEPGATVFITLNSDPVKDIVVSEEGEFFLSEVELDTGRNEFSAVAVDTAGNESQPAGVRVIYYLNKPPKLEVISPADRQKISGKDQFVEVRGTTDPGVKLMVNDRLVILTGSGDFVYRWGLTSGENKLVVQATDRAGNTTRREATVTYSP